MNSKQRQAVENTGGPMLVVAGAGTGKTRVITERIKWLIKTKKAQPSEILSLTFTEKAAAEMLDRVDVAMPLGYEEPWLSTFHSFAERVLREDGLEIGLDTSYKVLTPPQAWLFVRQNLFEFGLDYYLPLGNPTKFISAMLTLFSRAQDEDTAPEDFVKYAENVAATHASPKDDEARHAARLQETDKTIELANAYQTYQTLKIKESYLDFGDLISWTLKLFRERPSILKKYQDQFKYILVDEFQDTNYAQYQLIKLLAPSKNKPELMATGDDDQCLPPGTLITTPKDSKKIEDVKKGDEVITAVGKGHTSIGKVTKIFRNKRKRRLLTFETEGGKKITVTDNHKVFCFIPPVPKKKDRHFVYLMQQKDIGWRLGTTNDLAARLRLEHHADRIVGIGSFPTETEARYYETVYSLKYSIPTVCFAERPGIAIKDKWLEKLYQEFDTEKGARKLAEDLNIDLNAHHFAVDGVTRGQTRRVKINLMLCGRRYRSKWGRGGFLSNPSVYHVVYLETSDSETLQKLKKAGFHLQRAKKGMRYRFQSTDLREVGQKAEKLQKVTGGIIDHKFSVGTTNIQHRPARVMPAKNVLVGHHLPILKGREVIYDRVVKIKEEYKNVVTYDLEIERTHNFIANGVVVHNSIYKFRGASVSNILEFKKDYPNAKEVVLTKNYRSHQKILDAVYLLIQNNNPDRLEERLGIEKKLKSTGDRVEPARHRVARGESGGGIGDSKPGIIHMATGEAEAEEVVRKITTLSSQSPTLGWRDFAILARANNHLDPFVIALKRHGIPYQLIGNRGLFDQEEVRDVIAILRVLADPTDDVSFFRLLNIDVLQIEPQKIANWLNQARRERKDLWEILKTIETRLIASLPIKKYRKDIAKKSVTLLAFKFLDEIGYVKPLIEEESIENNLKIKNLNLFFDKIKEFESQTPEPNVIEFVDYLDLMMEAGESPAQAEIEDIDTVNLLTVHAAKGLEFPIVFLVNLVSQRFPTRNRKDKLPLPDELVKEALPEGDAHIQEERRLFYVGCTRAKEKLFLTWADNYGGKRKKKPSGFIKELGIRDEEYRDEGVKNKFEPLSLLDVSQTSLPRHPVAPSPPKYVSYSQLEAFSQCPLKYKYRYVLKIPTPPSHNLSFGQTIHRTLRDFHRDPPKADLNRLLKLYENHWLSEGYESQEHQQERFEEGKKILKEYFKKNQKLLGKPAQLEKKFTLRIGGIPLIGSIDRVDKLEDGGFEIVDYKTGKVKEQKYVDRDDQLTIYALGAKAALGIEPQSLALYFVNKNKKVSTTRTSEQLLKKRQEIEEQIEEIKSSKFEPKTSMLCNWCSYKNLCPAYKSGSF